ncbi:Hypothetical protein SRAE_1000228600 [Strongyloides ratti]|uniref:Lipoprotein n=1 Tax=Strongyloides ratti TaxID=34506 RepID=A0A090L925_STRRB|nr:Hypothetical protein SRAE_1000228600 [Strongyloides ratti]CEF64030.1 Hypothetical protein SRAE_1000228600 [Strongyloides ratti]
MFVPLLAYLIFLSFSLIISCSTKKKKNVEKNKGKIVDLNASSNGEKSKITTTKRGYSTSINSKLGKITNESNTKVLLKPQSSQSKGDEKFKVNNMRTEDFISPKKVGAKSVEKGKDSQKIGQAPKSIQNNCFSAAPTQANIFDPNDDPAADKMNLEMTQNSIVEDLKDGDDTLKNVYSLPVDKDQSLKVIEDAEGGNKPAKKTNK